jgi:hypothetical protein
MNKAVLLTLLMTFAQLHSVHAKSPVRYMNKYTLGIEYCAALRGQLITEAEVNALERMHVLKFHYSPFELVQFYVGAGLDRLEVEYEPTRKHFDGNYGISPAGGLSLNSPALVRKMLRITANLDLQYLNTKDDKEYKYSGLVLDPSGGILFHAGRLVDIEAGVMGHFIDGWMEDPGENKFLFSNAENLRGYFSFSLCSPVGAFAQIGINASQKTTRDFEEGPIDAAVCLSLGILISQDIESRTILERTNQYFPDFEKVKKREKDMKKDMD